VAKARTQTLTPRSLRAEPDGIAALARTGDGDWFWVNFEFEAEPPHKIVKTRIRCAFAPADEAERTRTDAELVASTRAFAERLTREGSFSGVVLIAKDGAPLLLEPYGMADRERKIPNEAITKFNVGSMNKMFTAIAIGQLVEAGKIAYSDPVGRFLPDYPLHSVRNATIEQLLTHTSGLGDVAGEQFFNQRKALRTPRDYIRVFGQDAPEGQGKWRYSNLGYMVLGRIIERVSGTTYEAYTVSHVFEPAGMKDTGGFPIDAEIENRAIPYTDLRVNEPPRVAPPTDAQRFLPMEGTPAFSGFSTAPDLLRFSVAFMGDKTISQATRAVLTEGRLVMDPAHPEARYGYGMIVRTTNGMRHFGHGGTGPGVNAIFEIVPERGYTVAVLANLDMPSADRVATRILSWIANTPAPEAEAAPR
jgi:CubicO group peptidase (beta-lactamase class C family)